jgi:predicted dehydrogenase
MASFDDVAKRLLIYDQRVEFKDGEPVPVKNAGEELPFARDEPLRVECQAFLDAIATGRCPRTDGESGVRVLRVIEAAQRSLEMQGQPVTMPLDAYSAIGSPIE